MTPVLRCEALRAGYPHFPVLGAVSFALMPGEVLALLGPNGGGKSTLLRTLSGIIPSLAGSIEVAGADLKSLTTREIARRIGFVPQEEAWHFDFRVEEVVSMGRLPISNGLFDTAEDHEAAESAMQGAGCYELRRRPITELSGGERQRVLIARALAQDTPILFLDEPTAHLDPQHQVEISALVRQLASTGKSVLVAVHDLPIAATMADRAMLVYAGRTSEVEPVRELLSGSEIDAAYAVEFDRLVTPEGRLVVVSRPRGSSRS